MPREPESSGLILRVFAAGLSKTCPDLPYFRPASGLKRRTIPGLRALSAPPCCCLMNSRSAFHFCAVVRGTFPLGTFCQRPGTSAGPAPLRGGGGLRRQLVLMGQAAVEQLVLHALCLNETVHEHVDFPVPGRNVALRAQGILVPETHQGRLVETVELFGKVPEQMFHRTPTGRSLRKAKGGCHGPWLGIEQGMPQSAKSARKSVQR